MKFDRRALGRDLSAIAAADVAAILTRAEDAAPLRTRVIGITGAPGAGKSTLIGRLAPIRLSTSSTLAILAIDPTSPTTDGSLLGDRIRMGAIADDERVYIRSLPSRSAIDGLTDNIVDLLARLDGAGFDEVLVETVGAGQTGYGMRAIADLAILVLTPNSGDYVQAMKAGVMETADLYVINKADLPGAENLKIEVESVLQRTRGDPTPLVIAIRAGDAEGIAALNAAIDRGLVAAMDPECRSLRERERRRYRIESLVARRMRSTIDTLPATVWDEAASAAYRRVLGAMRG